MKKIFNIGVILFSPLLAVSQTNQSANSADQDNLTEASIALDKYNDCAGAKRAIDKVSTSVRNDRVFLGYFAKIHECLNQLDSANVYYTKLFEITADPTLKKKIIELNYLINKKQFEIKNCHLCKGTGIKEIDMTCGACKGSGKREETCLECVGRGTKSSKCVSCDGYGRPSWDWSKNCERCNGEGRIKNNCIICKGAGKLERNCRRCEGFGEVTKTIVCPH